VTNLSNGCDPVWVANEESPGRAGASSDERKTPRGSSRQPDDSQKREARNPKKLETRFLNVHRAEMVLLAARYQVPAVYPWRFFAEIGGLLSYGSVQSDMFRTAATYVDRILKGEKAADLPVQAPTKYELVVNLKTANALGLDVPALLQQRADEVIE
jgi:ABC transporter substrate binding protein